MEICAVELD